MASEAILVTHLATHRHPLAPKQLEATTAPWRVVHHVCVRPPVREELDEFDESYPWAEAAASQREQFREIRDAMITWPDARVVYMGFVPIPLAFQLGSLFGQTTDLAIFQYHQDNRDWRWPSEDQTPELMASPMRFPAKPGSVQEVLIRVSGSYRVAAEDTQSISGDAHMHELELSLAHPHPRGMRSAADLEAFARAFKQVIDLAQSDFRRAPLRHLAAAVPVGAALAMGTQLNPTMHLPIQTWKYLGSREQKYVRALCLGEFVDLPRVFLLGASPIDEKGISAAAEVQELGELLARHRHRLSVIQCPAAGIDSLTKMLEEHNPTVLHLACHGELTVEGSTLLSLTTAEGWSCKVETEDFLRLLGRASRLCCVVLMACNSATLAKQIAGRIPVAIGCVGGLNDGDGRSFARDFWSSLIAGHSVAEAVRDAKMPLQGSRDQFRLEHGQGVNPDELVPLPRR